jgi:protection of telomeres protein 1
LSCAAREHYIAPGGTTGALPFLNAKWRACVRVTDFWPDRLEDFARPINDFSHSNNPEEEVESVSIQDHVHNKRYEWAFMLLLEDASNEGSNRSDVMPILVAHEDAEYLLKLDACE